MTIDPATHIGAVSLTVADLHRSINFYSAVLGLRALAADDQPLTAVLAAGGLPLLELVQATGALPRPPRSTGLYHFALLLPGRRDLARWLRHVADSGWPLQGASDHRVSEAIYLADPDGNGIEVYADRPRSQWTRIGDQIEMGVDPLNVPSLMAELANSEPPWQGAPVGTTMGHIHLHVADLAQAESFYCGALGFDRVALLAGSALFVSAGGYHHHIGLNVWAGRGAPPPPPGRAGLRRYQIVLPDRAALDNTLARLAATGVPFDRRDHEVDLVDPSQNGIRLAVESH